MSTDNIGDMLTRIRNGYMAGNREVVIPHTKLKEEIARVMVEEKYLVSFKVKKNEKGFKEIITTLQYVKDKPSIHKIKRISKPGLRIYKGAKNLYPILSGMGIAILSTSKGIMTAKQAKKQKIGGEVLCELW